MMILTRHRRAPALLLALAVMLSLTVLPGRAGRFQDVENNSRVSLAADTLASLGVVSGTGEGEFSPDGHLTRAQLCKMAVELLGMGEQAEAQAYRTIFTDMGRHWARGYVNVAATTQVPAESGVRLMLGLGNGRFGPDQEVTYQEAVTVALRILGYGAEAGRAWPRSAMETAALLGLDRDLSVERTSDPITRGQAVLLFYNMLTIPAKGQEDPCAKELGDLKKDTILLTADATINGREGWAVVASGDQMQSYPTAGPVDQSLLGRRGWALLDKEGRFITLLPDESSCVTGPVERKQAYYLYLNGLGRYSMSEDTTVYTGSAHDAGVTSYKDYMADLHTGDMVTLYLDEQGKVLGMYRAESSPETRFMIVNNSGITYDTFRALTGGDRNYKVRRNGASIPMNAIRLYDVVTYDPVSRVLDVCDVRLTCVYENASPSPSSPNRITAAGGNQFDVMADAISSFAGRKIGDSITLLFTSSGKVAGLLPKSADATPSFALGVIAGDEFRLLGCDLALKLPNGVPAGTFQGDILNAQSTQRGSLSLTPAGTKSSAEFDTVNMTLNGTRVSPGVQVYELTVAGLLSRNLTELPATVAASQYHRDNSGLVDLIILNGYSGDGINYGRIDVLDGYELVRMSAGGADNDGNKVKARWRLKTVEQLVFTGKDGTKTYTIPDGYHPGGYGAVFEYDGGFAGITYLQEITEVSTSDFFTQDGVTFVRTSKGVYQVDDNVLCFNETSSLTQSPTPPVWVYQILMNGGIWEGELPPGAEEGSWHPDVSSIGVEMFESLGECRNFADTVTIYIDSTGQQVRIISVKDQPS